VNAAGDGGVMNRYFVRLSYNHLDSQ